MNEHKASYLQTVHKFSAWLQFCSPLTAEIPVDGARLEVLMKGVRGFVQFSNSPAQFQLLHQANRTERINGKDIERVDCNWTPRTMSYGRNSLYWHYYHLLIVDMQMQSFPRMLFLLLHGLCALMSH